MKIMNLLYIQTIAKVIITKNLIIMVITNLPDN